MFKPLVLVQMRQSGLVFFLVPAAGRHGPRDPTPRSDPAGMNWWGGASGWGQVHQTRSTMQHDGFRGSRIDVLMLADYLTYRNILQRLPQVLRALQQIDHASRQTMIQQINVKHGQRN